MSECCQKNPEKNKVKTKKINNEILDCADNTLKDYYKDKSISWFKNMVPNALEYAQRKKAEGYKIAGIMCEYTPRELIMAAGGIPVCLCGGSVEMIPPAEGYLPANLCPLIKSTFGYGVKKANPFLEMADILIAETTCDGKKKMYELMAEHYPMIVLELPQKPKDEDAFQHWYRELKKLKSELEKRFNVSITDELLRTSIKKMNKERHLRQELAALMKVKNPPLTGRELLDFKSLISCIPDDFDQYEKAVKHLPACISNEPLESKIRVLLTGVPIPHGAERIMELIENNGGLVVSQENCTGIKPIRENIDENTDNPLLSLAEKYFRIPCSIMTKNDDRFNLLHELIEEYQPDCIIELIWQTCLTYDVESQYTRRMAERLKLPYLRIETDYSPSDNSRIITRIQALFETIKNKSKI